MSNTRLFIGVVLAKARTRYPREWSWREPVTPESSPNYIMG